MLCMCVYVFKETKSCLTNAWESKIEKNRALNTAVKGPNTPLPRSLPASPCFPDCLLLIVPTPSHRSCGLTAPESRREGENERKRRLIYNKIPHVFAIHQPVPTENSHHYFTYWNCSGHNSHCFYQLWNRCSVCNAFPALITKHFT